MNTQPTELSPTCVVQQTNVPPHRLRRDLASRPLVEGVEQLTPMQHLLQHRELAQALAVQLHLLEHPTSPQPSAMGEIKQLLDRWVCAGCLGV